MVDDMEYRTWNNVLILKERYRLFVKKEMPRSIETKVGNCDKIFILLMPSFSSTVQIFKIICLKTWLDPGSNVTIPAGVNDHISPFRLPRINCP
jgi:hypothetical protein